MDVNDLNLSLKEISRFYETAQSENTKRLLRDEIDRIKNIVNVDSKATEVKLKSEQDSTQEKENIPAPKNVQAPIVKQPSIQFQAIKKFAWDQDGYNGKYVFIYITIPGVGAAKDRVTCDFTETSFDLKAMDVGGVNYRLLKEPLNKEIEPSGSKFKVKKDRIVVTLKKTKGEYGVDHWTDLVEKDSSVKKKLTDKKDPTAGIMDMMKKMYDEGDDNMKKTIGEAMMKSRQERAAKGF